MAAFICIFLKAPHPRTDGLWKRNYSTIGCTFSVTGGNRGWKDEEKVAVGLGAWRKAFWLGNNGVLGSSQS